MIAFQLGELPWMSTDWKITSSCTAVQDCIWTTHQHERSERLGTFL
jgi:hypothetical protein